MSGEHVIPVRAPQDLRLKLDAEAQKNDRSLSAEVRVLLQEALSKRGERSHAA
jgi:hypothetical protein